MVKHLHSSSKEKKKKKSIIGVTATAGKSKHKHSREKEKKKRSRSKGEGKTTKTTKTTKTIVGVAGVAGGAPKKPETAFNMFAAKRRKELKNMLPTLTFAELSREVGDDWKLLLDAEKAPFEAAAKIAHDAYLAEKKAWELARGTSSEKKRAKAE